MDAAAVLHRDTTERQRSSPELSLHLERGSLLPLCTAQGVLLPAAHSWNSCRRVWEEKSGRKEQLSFCGQAAVSSARRGGRSESEQEELQPVWSQREGGSSDSRAALPRAVNTFKEGRVSASKHQDQILNQ
ncbi:LOW QUALITY PROTEIN: hypothetical protein ACER0C_004950 [Sarotherodon galilaeus]